VISGIHESKESGPKGPRFALPRRERLKAQGIGHKEKFEFGIWKLGTSPKRGSPKDNFEIKESQSKIRNPQLPRYAPCAMLYAT
jgi:hypothetical protein